MKRFLMMALTVATVFAATSAMASITTSKHNMNLGAATYAGAGNFADQICVYCHTPHNAAEAVPLWNRAQLGAPVTNYANDGADTTSNQIYLGAAVPVDSISGKCLSCHDGSVAPSSVVNNTNLTATAVTLTSMGSSADLGTLENDHPVGFTYSPSLDTDGVAGGPAFNTVAAATALGIKFFITGGVADQMECASCHAVHDTTEGFFLRTTNSGSALCLACHTK